MDNSVRLKVRVKLDTIDGSAEADDDYIPVNIIWIEKNQIIITSTYNYNGIRYHYCPGSKVITSCT